MRVPLRLTYRVVPGDHDFELGEFALYDAAFSGRNRPEGDVIEVQRRIYFDVVSTGTEGPDFCPTIHPHNRLLAELARVETDGKRRSCSCTPYSAIW